MDHDPRSDGVGFELAMFRRSGDVIVVTVRGMTRLVGVDVMVTDTRGVTRVVPVGDDRVGPLREYEAVARIDVVPGVAIEVRGGGRAETVIGSELPEGVPVVCTADPSAEGLPPSFLHKRGERLVLTSADDVRAAGRGVDRTTLVA